MEELGKLHPKEIELIQLMRMRFRHGELVIIMRDGIPWRIMKGFEFTDLTGELDKEV